MKNVLALREMKRLIVCDANVISRCWWLYQIRCGALIVYYVEEPSAAKDAAHFKDFLYYGALSLGSSMPWRECGAVRLPLLFHMQHFHHLFMVIESLDMSHIRM